MTKKYFEVIKIILGFIGVTAGGCACVVFAVKYHNYNASIWAGVSTFAAIFLLYMICSVRRDIQLSILPSRFSWFMVISAFGILTGLSVFVTYLVIGARRTEGDLYFFA